jgi:hypothetical protein
MVETAVKACILCQASYPGPKVREPLNPTPFPTEPWSELAIDFAGPFPTGDYLMVCIDEYSRFPEVEIVSSTSARCVLPKLEEIFSRQGIPKTVKTDNGAPFNGQEFSAFADQFGFHHRKITPVWPEANGEVEKFMSTVKKNIHASTAENKNWKKELPTFLRHYRATPHNATNVPPFEALTGRKMSIGLPSAPVTATPLPVQTRIVYNDSVSKQKMMEYANAKCKTQPLILKPGDHVLVKQYRKNALYSPYSSRPYVVTQKKGSMVTAQHGKNTIIVRNSSHFKPIRGVLSQLEEEEEEEDYVPPILRRRPDVTLTVRESADSFPSTSAQSYPKLITLPL